jgi:hypothetical protein
VMMITVMIAVMSDDCSDDDCSDESCVKSHE